MNVLDINIKFTAKIPFGIVRLLYQHKAVKFEIYILYIYTLYTFLYTYLLHGAELFLRS